MPPVRQFQSADVRTPAAGKARTWSREVALKQDIRGDAHRAAEHDARRRARATERQFFRLVGESNQIAQFYVHPFTLGELARGAEAQAYVAQYYESFERIQEQGLDALIITGANVTQPDPALEPF